MNDSHKSPLPFPIHNCNISDLLAAGYFNETFDDSYLIEEPYVYEIQVILIIFYHSLDPVNL